MLQPSSPCPADLSHLRPTNRHGVLVCAVALMCTTAGIWLSTPAGVAVWSLGQLCLAAALVQWFVILHEAGHDTLVRSRHWNAAAGKLAGLIAMIPYRCWRRIHGRHHKWTGWQDLDPTTEMLVARERGRAERMAVNACWRFWIPLFSVVYRAQNHWNLRRLERLFPRAVDRRALRRSVIASLAIYVALVVLVGPLVLIRVAGVAILLSLIVEDVLLLSQHTHVPQEVSHGREVRPFPASEQAAFTRSLRLPNWISTFLLHFDAHELHHMYPFVPGYHLRRVPLQTPNEVGWRQWIAAAKRLKGEVFLFQNRLDTGWDL